MSTFTAEDFTVKGAAALDAAEPNLRSEFVIPTRSDIASKYLQNGRWGGRIRVRALNWQSSTLVD